MRQFCLCFLFSLSAAAASGEGRLAVNDPSGAIYSVTGRYNNGNDYVHIMKMDERGYPVWENDYFSNSNLKPVQAATDADSLIILNALEISGHRTFSLVKYSYQNYLVWDQPYDDGFHNIPVGLAVGRDGSIYICGQRKDGALYTAKLWSYDSSGRYLWSAEYYAGGNNSYARTVQVLFDGTISLGVTVFNGSASTGQYQRLAVQFDQNGRKIF